MLIKPEVKDLYKAAIMIRDNKIEDFHYRQSCWINHPLRKDEDWTGNCGTVGCVFGAAVLILNPTFREIELVNCNVIDDLMTNLPESIIDMLNNPCEKLENIILQLEIWNKQ